MIVNASQILTSFCGCGKISALFKEVLTMCKVLNKTSYSCFSGAKHAAASFYAHKICLVADTVLIAVSFFLIDTVFFLSSPENQKMKFKQIRV